MSQAIYPQSPAAIQTAQDYAPTPDEATLLQRTHEWRAAVTPFDEPRLRDILAPDFTLQIWDGSRARQNIDSWLDMAKNHLTITAFDQTGVNAQIFGDAALVFSRFSWSGRIDGRAFSDRGFITDFWQRRKDNWRVVSRRSAPMQQIQQLVEAPLPGG